MPAWWGWGKFLPFYLRQLKKDHVLIIIKATVVWDVTPCGVVDLYKCVEGLATGSSNVDM